MAWATFDTVTSDIWSQLANASDGSTDTYASGDGAVGWITFNLTTPKYATKCRMWLEAENSVSAIVETYYGGDWHKVYDQADATRGAWIEFDINRTISGVRYKDENGESGWTHTNEMQYQFEGIAVRPLVGGSPARGSLAGGALAK